ncbi:hypothetical protein LB526_19140 [Mesorhizobium sp. CA6]|uniref:hypothetical protein n=1 Tax=Mesorhizobium sp. CA6 TaxID=588500 RepID=UPI001CCC8003|nr:hypothetical protein [Mesorhizobium sp. CA6]MBZ9768875.1 hypothetical protein [Mesorhizobium sp. CA6]
MDAASDIELTAIAANVRDGVANIAGKRAPELDCRRLRPGKRKKKRSRIFTCDFCTGRWATETERQVDRGEIPTKSRIARLKIFGELIDFISTTCAM